MIRHPHISPIIDEYTSKLHSKNNDFMQIIGLKTKDEL